jgi:hypothetical protein
VDCHGQLKLKCDVKGGENLTKLIIKQYSFRIVKVCQNGESLWVNLLLNYFVNIYEYIISK